MRLVQTFLISIVISMLISVGPAFSFDITTYRGKVSVSPNPKKIAVFDIPGVDTLQALGVKIDGVPNNLYLPRLRETLGSAAKVGSLFQLDLEALNALGPDLIIVGGRSSRQLDHAKKVAPAIDMTIWGTDLLGQVRARISDYGKIFDREKKAEELIAKLDAKLAEAKVAVKGKGTGMIVMTNGPKISVYGLKSRFGWLHQYLELPEAIKGKTAGTHGEAASFEFIAKANPDWLIIMDRAAAIGSGDQNAKATLDNVLVRSTTAWKKNQVVYLPSADMYIAAGGATSTVKVFETIIEAFSRAE